MKKVFKYKLKKSVTYFYFVHDLFKTEEFLTTCHKIGSQFVIISDKKVASLYGYSLLNFMKRGGCHSFLITIEVGEGAKNRKTKETIEDAMCVQQCGYDTCLIAIGGGVVTDVGGFVAATYCRGIQYLTVPTSLLGMVDAAIGGKTGINLKYGKNLIGALYPPHSTFLSLSMLDTLPKEELRNGVAEIIKYGLVYDSSLFYKIANNFDKWQQQDLIFLKSIIIKSCMVKQNIVHADFLGIGVRHILNFGHTIGHAIEKVESYRISHGEALAIGIIIESLISHKMGYLSRKSFLAICHLIRKVGFSLTLSKEVTMNGMVETMSIDKKAEKGCPRFVILKDIGSVLTYKGSYCITIDKNLLHEVIYWMIEEFVFNEVYRTP